MNRDLPTLYVKQYFSLVCLPSSVVPSFDSGERPPVPALLRSRAGEAGCEWGHRLCCTKR